MKKILFCAFLMAVGTSAWAKTDVKNDKVNPMETEVKSKTEMVIDLTVQNQIPPRSMPTR